MSFPPTATELIELDGITQRIDTYTFTLLDKTGASIGALHPSVEQAPRIRNDATAAMPRTLDQLLLPASETQAINPVSDLLQVHMVLQEGTRYSLGVFLWADDSRPIRAWGTEHNSSLVDRMAMLNQQISVTFGRSTNAHVLNTAVDLAEVIIGPGLTDTEADSSTFAAPIGYAPGTNRLEIINNCMTLIGYLPAYFNRDGRLQYRSIPDLEQPTDLVYGPGTHMVAGSWVESDDIIASPNRFAVYDNSGQGTAIVGSYDISDVQPHSIANRGWVLPHVESQQGLMSVAQANKAARALAITTRRNTFRYQQFQSTADPRHDTWDVVELAGNRYLETAWDLELRAGAPMNHTLRQIY